MPYMYGTLPRKNTSNMHFSEHLTNHVFVYRVSRNCTTIKVPREFTWKSKSKMFLEICIIILVQLSQDKTSKSLNEVYRMKKKTMLFFEDNEKKCLATCST